MTVFPSLLRNAQWKAAIQGNLALCSNGQDSVYSWPAPGSVFQCRVWEVEMKLILIAAIAGSIFSGGCTSCGSGPQGTYSDPVGSFILELRSGGKATFTVMGDAASCTYRVDGNKLMLACKNDKATFTMNDDGSLTSPPGTFMPPLRKGKRS
jgi:hypothetical protein